MLQRLTQHAMFRQGGSFIAVGVAQLLLDWLVFVVLTAVGVPAAPSNLAGRACGALLGFWLNGRLTFAQAGAARLGWWRFTKFLLVWVPLTAISTLAVTWVASGKVQNAVQPLTVVAVLLVMASSAEKPPVHAMTV